MMCFFWEAVEHRIKTWDCPKSQAMLHLVIWLPPLKIPCIENSNTSNLKINSNIKMPRCKKNKIK